MTDDGRTSRLLPLDKTLAYEAEYRAWLAARGLTGRSLGDVISRTRRAAALANILAAGSDAEVVFHMTQDARFERLTGNVKSQIKRAVVLYRTFHRARRPG